MALFLIISIQYKSTKKSNFYFLKFDMKLKFYIKSFNNHAPLAYKKLLNDGL